MNGTRNDLKRRVDSSLIFLFPPFNQRKDHMPHRSKDGDIDEAWDEPARGCVIDKVPVCAVFTAKYASGILNPFPNAYDQGKGSGKHQAAQRPKQPESGKAVAEESLFLLHHMSESLC